MRRCVLPPPAGSTVYKLTPVGGALEKTLTAINLAHLRLHNQHIAGAPFTTPAEAVQWLGAMQAQDYPGALWSVGLRMQGVTVAEVERAITERAIIRTWPMRGTLHFVAPADVRWMLKLLTPRVIANSARRHAQLGLDETTNAASQALFARALEGGKQLTRTAMLAVLEEGGIATTGQRGYYLLTWAAQVGLICFGPMQGKEQTFVLLDEWVPAGKELSRGEALVELAVRYFTGHGPATVKDFAWWTGLTMGDARASVAAAGDQLAQTSINGQSYWIASAAPDQPGGDDSLYLLPGFDEYLLGYGDRSAVLDPQYANRIVPGGNGVFYPTIVSNGQVVGTWKRTFKKGAVVITASPFTNLTPAEKERFAAAAQRYANYLGLTLVLA